MAAWACLKDKEAVLEIGPGKGVLTEKLLQTGARVVAVEKDRAFIPLLKEKFAGCSDQLKIVEGDILKKLPELAVSLKKYKVVANIPYYLTNHLIRQLLETRPRPQKIILMIQKEVAQRIIAQAPKATLLGVAVQFYARAKILLTVPKEKFRPQPKVDSAVISIVPEKKVLAEEKIFFKVLKTGFSQPRKTLKNNLATLLAGDNEKAEQWLAKCKIKPNQRAQELKLKDWTCLVKNF